ncbi:MAG TPA: hypothetical protein VHC97_08205 [Thermoanaerobaculia bacterium]|jgi:hypothetical protein|nr:hypothetical protein [Thermoanaerobaculia bacterium]
MFKSFAIAARVLSVAVLCFFLQTAVAAARVMYMVGNISGTVNGTPVDFDLNIRMDMATGEETATVSRMDPEMGAILRQVTAMVTVAGPTGGSTQDGAKNLFQLSGGNFVNLATMYWPRTNDRLELVHTVSYTGGDTMKVSATINGTVPVISADQEVKYRDFTEIMYWGPGDRRNKRAARTVTTGVGYNGDFSKAKYRSYTLQRVNREGKAEEDPVEDETAKGSTTIYVGEGPSEPVLRSARNMSSTYEPKTRTMTVHLYNALIPVEADSTRPEGSPREPREH